MVRITKWHLAMESPGQLRPAPMPPDGPEVRRVEVPMPEWSRFLYVAVGWPWQWVDRLPWSWQEWQRHLSQPTVETWVAWWRGTPAGYHELEHRADGTTEILYLGLVPACIGRGIGGGLLTHAVERAWAAGARRVILNTCSLDHPAALAAYQARGFQVEREEVFERTIPAPADGPWPGSGPAGGP